MLRFWNFSWKWKLFHIKNKILFHSYFPPSDWYLPESCITLCLSDTVCFSFLSFFCYHFLDVFFCKWNFCQDIISVPSTSLLSFLFLYFLKSKNNSKKTNISWSKRAVYIDQEKGFIQILEDKLRMVILSSLIASFSAQSQGHEQKAFSLFLLCSVCFGWTKSWNTG